MDQAWFEFQGIKDKPLTGGVWIPLRASQVVDSEGESGAPGNREEYLGVYSFAFHHRHRDRVLKLPWDSVSHSNSGPIAERNRYTPTGFRLSYGSGPVGIELVLEQRIPRYSAGALN